LHIDNTNWLAAGFLGGRKMVTLDELGIEGIKGMIFDCYNTLIDIKTDESDLGTYEPVSKWLIYQGVRIEAEELKREYARGVKEYMESRWEAHAEVRVEEVLKKICERHAVWEIDSASLGNETARAFRAGSLRRLQAFPQSLSLLRALEAYPKAIVSNGQRVFSELELRYFGLYDRFQHVIFSSDFGHKKPDPRIFLYAAKKLELEPEEIICIGDNFDNDLVPSAKLGMRAMHIEEAWRLFSGKGEI
jgi:putative hydrolase of the HAD superfamily